MLSSIDFESKTRSVKKHGGQRVTFCTKSEWKKIYPRLIIEEERMKMTCEICTKLRSKLKLATVWAGSGTPNIQASSIVRHNESVDHRSTSSECEKEIGE